MIAERPDVPVVVIRTEHLWDDVHRLNNVLDGIHKSAVITQLLTKHK